MTPQEILIEARARIARGWVQGRFAQDNRGVLVHSYSSEAVSWCLDGALIAVGATSSYTDYHAAHDLVWGALGEPREPRISNSLTRWNDAEGRTQDEVLAVLDRAIGAA